MPIYNEVKAIKAGLNTLAEVMALNSNVAVIATKLQKRGSKDRFSAWDECEDTLNIQTAVHSLLGKHIPVLPLKQSTAFDAIFEREASIRQMMKASPLLAYQYREVAKQFDAIYSLIDHTHAK